MENNTNNDNQLVIKAENKVFSEVYCPMTSALNVIGGKWKILLLTSIKEECPARFGELKKKLQFITQATLTAQLRELERDGIISRKVYAEAPPKVEYKLTELGKTLIPVIDTLWEWTNNYCKMRA